MLGNDTLFTSIRAVPPASVLTYDARSGALTSRRYWELRPGSPIATQREALSTIDECFARAVERRTQGRGALGLSLSGGLDARTILAAIPRNGTTVTCVSLGIPGSIDHRAAEKLAGLSGVPHHAHYLQRDFLDHFPAYLQRLVFLTDGHYLDQAITGPTLEVYRNLGIEVLLRGHAGELLHMDKAYILFHQARRAGLPHC